MIEDKSKNKAISKLKQLKFSNKVEKKCLTDKTLHEQNMPGTVYVINLDSCPERWEKVKAQLDCAGINNAQRFSATDGYKVKITNLETNQTFYGLDIKNKFHSLEKGEKYKITCNPESDSSTQFDFLGYEKSEGGTISAGELGIWCSNIRLWKEISDNALIFEDDVILKNPETFKQDLNNYITHLPESYDLAYLDTHSHSSDIKEYSINEYVNAFKSDSVLIGAYSIMFNKQAIEKLLSIKEYTYPIDMLFCCLTTGFNSYTVDFINECKDSAGTLTVYNSKIDLLDVNIDSSIINEMGRI